MTPNKSSIIPALRYRNAPAAIEWLCENFGFQKHVVFPGDNNTIAHAQLTLGASMIMLSSVTDSDFSRLMKQPDEIGGAETISCYVIVEDADAHYAKAKAGGAHIAVDIKTESYGGRGYTCQDLEGHIWSFGTFDPWHEQ